MFGIPAHMLPSGGGGDLKKIEEAGLPGAQRPLISNTNPVNAYGFVNFLL